MQPLSFPLNSEKIISEQDIELALDALAITISRRLGDSNPVAISVLHGGLLFTAELLKRFPFALQQDYLHATRYAEQLSGGQLRWLAEPTLDLQQRTVLLLDDIFDEGDTLKILHDYCYEKGAEKVYSAVLIKKSKQRDIEYSPDFYALTAPDKYLFGMGMDYKGYWRNKKAIYAIMS